MKSDVAVAWAVVQSHFRRPFRLDSEPLLHPLHVEVGREGDAVVLTTRIATNILQPPQLPHSETIPISNTEHFCTYRRITNI